MICEFKLGECCLIRMLSINLLLSLFVKPFVKLFFENADQCIFSNLMVNQLIGRLLTTNISVFGNPGSVLHDHKMQSFRFVLYETQFVLQESARFRLCLFPPCNYTWTYRLNPAYQYSLFQFFYILILNFLHEKIEFSNCNRIQLNSL